MIGLIFELQMQKQLVGSSYASPEALVASFSTELSDLSPSVFN